MRNDHRTRRRQSTASRMSPGRALGNGRGIFPINNPASAAARAATPGAPRARELCCYLTSFSIGPRRGPCGDLGSCEFSREASCSRNIASHKAFSSESAMPLSFIRSPRTATDTNWAVSRLPPSARIVRHCSRVERTDRSRCSELDTSVFSVTELARQGGGNPVRRFIYLSIKSGYFRNGAMDLVGRDVVEGVAG